VASTGIYIIPECLKAMSERKKERKKERKNERKKERHIE
jgi:hypothetical protein